MNKRPMTYRLLAVVLDQPEVVAFVRRDVPMDGNGKQRCLEQKDDDNNPKGCISP